MNIMFHMWNHVKTRLRKSSYFFVTIISDRPWVPYNVIPIDSSRFLTEDNSFLLSRMINSIANLNKLLQPALQIFVYIFAMLDGNDKHGNRFIDDSVNNPVIPVSVFPKCFQRSPQRFSDHFWRLCELRLNFLQDLSDNWNIKFLEVFCDASLKD